MVRTAGFVTAVRLRGRHSARKRVDHRPHLQQSTATDTDDRGSWGYIVHLGLAVGAIGLVLLAGRARLVALAAAVGGVWQFAAVRGATLINTTFVPYLGFIAAFVFVVAAVIPDRAIPTALPPPMAATPVR